MGVFFLTQCIIIKGTALPVVLWGDLGVR